MKHSRFFAALVSSLVVACTTVPPSSTSPAPTSANGAADGTPDGGASSAPRSTPEPIPTDAGSDAATSSPFADLLTIETGALPLVLSAPHGGELPVPGVAERASPDAVTDLDYATYELTTAIQAGLLARTGKRAYLVAAKASRKYIDFNRAAAEAYEVPQAAAVYEAYHAALGRAVAAIKVQAPGAALVVDVHGQSADVTAVLRGTRDGQTASLATLHATPKGFLTVLLASGVKVSPAGTSGLEDADFNGGYIVASQGLVGRGNVNAVQLEFGLDYRDTPALVKGTAEKVAAALVAHLEMTGGL